MTDRHARLISLFLEREGWGEAQRVLLAGDASSRQYQRLTNGPEGRQAVLMDASSAPETAGAFLRIAHHLSSLGLSAPDIYAALSNNGLVLLEDFGNALFPQVLAQGVEAEQTLYLAATEGLLALQASPAPKAPLYDGPAMAEAIGLAHDWYGFGATGQRDEAGKAELCTRLSEALAALPPWRPVLALRDYHAENLFWLPQRIGPARVGLIDFQDAVLTHPAYDLISLAYDVRREVAPATIEAMFAHFAEATGTNRAELDHAAAALTAQRNLRILGVFARLSLQAGKAQYVALIPQVWDILQTALTHPALAPLAAAVHASLPPPTPDVLSALKK